MHEATEESEARPVWAWIDLDALRHNARRAIELASGRSVIGVVKADGYGHGGPEIARGLLAEGVGRLAVVSVAEGAALRRAGIVAPILLMGGLGDLVTAQRALKWGLTPVLHDRAGFELALAVGRGSAPLAVEVEVDTGMRRMGVSPTEAVGLLREVASASQLSLSGIYTHLACSDAENPASARAQVAALSEIVSAAGASAVPTHVVNSGGLLRREEFESGYKTDAVRPGLMLYGVSPFSGEGGPGEVGSGKVGPGEVGQDEAVSAEVPSSGSSASRQDSAADLDLRPVMTVAARVVGLREIAEGDSVGYGAAWRAPQATRVATLPLGYADGIPRAVLGRGEVFLAGARRPIVGRVSMDYITVDVGGAEDRAGAACEIGSVATIFGQSPEGERVPVEELAAAAGTIGYEILTGIGDRVTRHFANGPPKSLEPSPLDRAV